MIKPIIFVKMPCKPLIQVKRTKIKGYNFLALPDIKLFGHLYSFTMLLLIGYSQNVFV